MAKKALGDFKDPALAPQGQLRIEWAAREMPVLALLRQRFAESQPLRGLRIAACLHVTTETANLMLVLKEGGAQMALCASNPLSTQDDVAAALVELHHMPVFAIKGEDNDTYYKHIQSALEIRPQITMDDGADLVATLHRDSGVQIKEVIGGTEETTTGVIRLRSLAKEGGLKYPIIAVNEAETKHLFDNRYGTGQSTIDGITRATNVLWAGKQVVVCGYGWCGKGIALRAKALGAKVIVTEVNAVRALEAAMEGYQVAPIKEAAEVGDIFITATGCAKVIGREHLLAMKEGAILANSGHFNVEIDLEALEALSQKKRAIRPSIEEYVLPNSRRLYLLGEGRLINLAAAEGHPASVMDMSFANQALSVEYLAKQGSKLNAQVYPVPEEIDKEVGRLKLASMGISIDALTPEQQRYLESWESGT